MPLTPEERSQRARFAAQQSWANEPNPRARTAPARAALWKRFLDQVDPDRVLPEADRVRRATAARKGFYARMRFESMKAKRVKREAREARLSPRQKAAAEAARQRALAQPRRADGKWASANGQPAAAAARANGSRKRKPVVPGVARDRTDHHLDPTDEAGSVNQINPSPQEKQVRDEHPKPRSNVDGHRITDR